MLYFVTGVPGSSKTLNVIKFVRDTFKDRPIYYHNIAELKLPWTQITREQVFSWYDYPDGSLFIIDEAQQLFPPRKSNAETPQHIARLDTHRHRAFDFVIITQHPTLVDAALRRFVTEHWHFVRPFGMSYAKRYMWSDCCNDPQSKSQQKTALASRVQFDKSIYGLYKSAEVHTAKPRVPSIVIGLVFMLLAVPALLYFYFERHSDTQDAQTAHEPAAQSAAIADEETGPIFGGNDEMTKERWLSLRMPRIPGLPWTAPIYDELQKPVSFPRPQCLIFRKKCRCYSQQATRMDGIGDKVCIDIVNNGYFDATRPDTSNISQSPLTGEPGARANAESAPGPRVSFIPASTDARRPVKAEVARPVARGHRAASFDESMYYE